MALAATAGRKSVLRPKMGDLLDSADITHPDQRRDRLASPAWGTNGDAIAGIPPALRTSTSESSTPPPANSSVSLSSTPPGTTNPPAPPKAPHGKSPEPNEGSELFRYPTTSRSSGDRIRTCDLWVMS